jgi:uncharacterized membrane protein
MDATTRCPHCGHELSMWHAPAPRRSEVYAMRVADHVASWWFSFGLLAAIGAWIVWNVIAKPFNPYPVIIFAVISAVLATIASLQGPLILLSQRRASMRDRERDEETLRVAINAETDLHRVEEKVDALLAVVTSTKRTT